MILHFSLQWSHRNFCSTFLSWARTQNTGLAYFQYCTHFVWCCVCVCVCFVFLFCSCGSSQRPSCHVQFSFIETLLSTDPNNPMHVRIVFPTLKTHTLQVSPLHCMLSGNFIKPTGWNYTQHAWTLTLPWDIVGLTTSTVRQTNAVLRSENKTSGC